MSGEPQVGHYKFTPRTNTVVMIGGPINVRDTMTSLFEACGWKVKFKPAKRANRRTKKV
jgi:hypothetical protein